MGDTAKRAFDCRNGSTLTRRVPARSRIGETRLSFIGQRQATMAVDIARIHAEPDDLCGDVALIKRRLGLTEAQFAVNVARPHSTQAGGATLIAPG